jgi:hypothetical protein
MLRPGSRRPAHHIHVSSAPITARADVDGSSRSARTSRRAHLHAVHDDRIAPPPLQSDADTRGSGSGRRTLQGCTAPRLHGCAASSTLAR